MTQGKQRRSTSSDQKPRNVEENKKPLRDVLQAIFEPLSDSSASVRPSSYVLPLICSYTGLTIGGLTVTTVAGHMPLLGQWKDTMVAHPLFSLEHGALLKFSRNCWHHFCSLSPDEAANQTLTEKQELLLRVATLALLHKLTDVYQSTPWLPSIVEVNNNWQSILTISYWKNYLESKRFQFPALRISKHSPSPDLYSFLQACWDVKKDYESKVREKEEQEKAAAAEAALVGIRNELAGKSPRSKKLLWRWFLAHMPSKYARDTDGWMWDLFDAETETEISEFTTADIDLFEEIVLSEIPTGSSVSHAFLERIEQKRKLRAAKFELYEIVIPQNIQTGVADGTISMVEPKLSDFPSKTKFLIAQAKWKLATADGSKTREAKQKELEADRKVTVKHTYFPGLDIGSDALDDDPLPVEPKDVGIDTSDLQDDDDANSGDLEI
jgi:hypothetical protein